MFALRGRVRALFAGSRNLVRIAYRDPEHLPERLALNAVERLGEPSLAWAQGALAARPGEHPAVLAEELRRQSASVARIDGAVAGTPFFVALVPGYLGYLLQEAQMVMRMAALYGCDPRELRAAAELLSLRGLHPTVDAAAAALEACRTAPLPERPERRRPLRHWVRSVYAVLVLGGFLSPRGDRATTPERSKLVVASMFVLGVGSWIVTWVFPVTFMLLMAWGCESNARDLGRRALAFYGGGKETTDAAIASARSGPEPGLRLRRVVRAIALALSIALPVAFVAYADHIRNTTGVNAFAAAGALVALSLVIATTVVARRG